MGTEQVVQTEEAAKERKCWKKLSGQEKWRIFMETTIKDAPVGEILRRHGLYSSELTKIRRQAEEGALKEFGKNRHSKRPESVPYAEHEKVKAELTAKEKALAQMSEEYLILKKSLS